MVLVDFVNKIIQGDALEVLKQLPDEIVDCVITSPPYWGCRKYSDDPKEIGLEDHPQKYIDKIVEIVCECMRVLKKTGTMFLNLGDVWYTKTNPGGYDRLNKEKNKTLNHRINVREKYKSNWLQKKQRLLLPFRIAIALQERGYIIRDVIIWVKKMLKYPEMEQIGTTVPFPCRDRFLPAHEYIFLIVKSRKYYFNLEPLKTHIKETAMKRIKYSLEPCQSQKINTWNVHLHLPKSKGELLIKAMPSNCVMFKLGNQLTVPSGHYAKFPESLVEFCILAGCPENGIVLDPFMGSGTVAVVAKKLGRNFIGIELNPKYIEIANKRTEQYPLLNI